MEDSEVSYMYVRVQKSHVCIDLIGKYVYKSD